MWKPIYHPGPWKQYLKRKDNAGLPLMEVRKKYLNEQLYFDNLVSSQNVNMVASNVIGTGGPLSRVAEQGGNVAPSFATNVYMKLETVVKGSILVNQITFELQDTEGGLINGKAYYQSTTKTISGEGTEIANTVYYIRWDGTDHWELFTTANSAGVMSSNTDVTGDVPYPSTWTLAAVSHGLLDDDGIVQVRDTSWYA